MPYHQSNQRRYDKRRDSQRLSFRAPWRLSRPASFQSKPDLLDFGEKVSGALEALIQFFRESFLQDRLKQFLFISQFQFDLSSFARISRESPGRGDCKQGLPRQHFIECRAQAPEV